MISISLVTKAITPIFGEFVTVYAGTSNAPSLLYKRNFHVSAFSGEAVDGVITPSKLSSVILRVVEFNGFKKMTIIDDFSPFHVAL